MSQQRKQKFVNKAYGGSEMRTRQKQGIDLVVKQRHLNTWQE